MTIRLVGEAFTVEVDPTRAEWRLQPHRADMPVLHSAFPALAWKRSVGARQVAAITDGAIDEQPDVQTPQGPARRLSLRAGMTDGLDIRVVWQLSPASPVVQWRVEVANTSTGAVRIERIDLCRGFLSWERSDPACGTLNPAFFTNGWQSWSYTGALGRSDVFPRTRLGPLTSPMRVNPGTLQPRGRGRFSSDLFGVVACRARRTGVLLGFLSQSQAFGSLAAELDSTLPRLRAWANGDDVLLKPGAVFATDWLAAQPVGLDANCPLDPYLDAVARENNARLRGQTPTGWCSWYYFFTEVREADVIANLEWLRERREEMPLEVIQIDDGYEADVGDWDGTRPSFPSGMAALASRIRAEGFRPGIWLAPFIAKPTASLVREHPDWVLRHPSGRPVNAGYVWDTFARALDVTQPRVVEWACDLVRTSVREWGFEYLKLDFLYAGALAGRRHDPALTRAQALRRALEALRREVGDQVTLVGCGCPLGSGVGIFDAMRIGPDVAPRWRPAYRGIETFFRAEPDFPSARNSVRNTITRAMLHRRWWVNDPDCLLLRSPVDAMKPPRDARSWQDRPPPPSPTPISGGALTEAEVQTLATAVALSAGSLIVSEHMPLLDPERGSWLARLIPPLPAAARVIDWMDASSPGLLLLPLEGPTGKWHLVAVINWADRPGDVSVPFERLGLPAAAYHIVDFWQGSYGKVVGPELRLTSIPAHGTRLLALRPEEPGPQWIGDTIHVSQGLLVREWDVGVSRLRALLEMPRIGSGRVWLSLPGPPGPITCNERPLTAHVISGSVCAIDIVVPRRAELEVPWA